VVTIAIINTTVIFLLKLYAKIHTRTKNITAFSLFVTRYPTTFEIARNAMKYRKYLLVNNFDASLAKVIIYIIFKKN
jgi:hypothetical protein